MEHLCLDFVNSEFRNFRGLWTRDDLQNPQWLADFLARWHLPVAAPPDVAVIAQFSELRELLVHVIESLNRQQRIEEQDVAALNTRLRQTPFTQQIIQSGQAFQLASLPIERDWNWVQSEIITDLLSLLRDREPARLKICQNEHCRWIFYDETRSRTRRYCTADKCANLVKLRRFRARHKLEKQADFT